MLLLWIIGILEGVFADLRAPQVVMTVDPTNEPRSNPPGRMTPEWPTGFL